MIYLRDFAADALMITGLLLCACALYIGGRE